MKPTSERTQPRKRELSPDRGEFLHIYSEFLQEAAQNDLAAVQSQNADDADLNATDEKALILAGSSEPPRDDATTSVFKRSPSIPFRSMTRDIPSTQRKRKRVVRSSLHTRNLDVANRSRTSESAERRLLESELLLQDEHSPPIPGSSNAIQKDNRPFNYIPTILDSSLDPFFTLPDNVVLNPNQKAYIHLYYKELSPAIFGTTPQALYCPRYTVGFHTARMSPAGIMWLIVVAMQCANVQRGRSPDRALHSQIRSAYDHLHVAMQNARQNPVGVCLALMFANLAEVILGTNRLQGLYTTAIEKVVEEAGGLRTFLRMSPLPGVYLIAVYTFLSHRPRSLKELEMVKLHWISGVADMQRQLLKLRDTLRRAQSRRRGSPKMSLAVEGSQKKSEVESTTYSADDPRSFSAADSEMMPMMRAMIMPRAETGHMPQTTAIYLMKELIWALIDFGGHPERMRRYHRRMNFLIRHSLVAGGEVAATSYMAAGMVTLIVARARQETYQDMIGVEDEDVKVERTRTSIDCLKIFAALRESGREVLLETFRSWVLDIADVSKPLKTFSEESTSMLGSEVLENWFEGATNTG